VPITNRFPWQTRLAVQELLDLAAQMSAEVRIVTGSGSDKAYGGDLAKAMRQAIEKKCRFRILVWNDEQHPYGKTLAELQNAYNTSLSIRMSGTRSTSGTIPHFLTVGDSAYRLEMPHPPYDDMQFSDTTPETKAQICFNDTSLTRILNAFFDKVWAAASPQPAAPDEGV
jgi:hypothetical protein